MRRAHPISRVAGLLMAVVALCSPFAVFAEPLDGVVRIRSATGGGSTGSGFIVRLDAETASAFIFVGRDPPVPPG